MRNIENDSKKHKNKKVVKRNIKDSVFTDINTKIRM